MPKREWSQADRDLIANMNAAGASQRSIAKALGVSPRTLRRYFDELLDPQEGGTPVSEFTEEQRDLVEAMAGFGLTREDIAIVMKLSVSALEANFREELERGLPAANARVASSLFQMATRDKIPSAAIFWLKARAGWRDHLSVSGEINHSGKVEHDHDHTVREGLRSLSKDARSGLRVVLSELGASSALTDEPATEGEPVH